MRLAVAPVRALLATAVEEGLIRSNPAAGPAPRAAPSRDGDEAEERVKALSEEELVTLLAAIAARAPEWLLFFEFLAWSGLRIGEAVELRWKTSTSASAVQVRRRFDGGRVGPPKSRYGRRTLRLTPELARALWRLRGETKAGDEELVFTAAGRRPHRPVEPDEPGAEARRRRGRPRRVGAA